MIQSHSTAFSSPNKRTASLGRELPPPNPELYHQRL